MNTYLYTHKCTLLGVQAALPAQVAAVPFNWPSVPLELLHEPGGFFSACNPAAADPTTASGPAALREQSYHSREGIRQQVAAAAAAVVGGAVGADAPLMAAGLDSLGAVELRNLLQTALALQLPGLKSKLIRMNVPAGHFLVCPAVCLQCKYKVSVIVFMQEHWCLTIPLSLQSQTISVQCRCKHSYHSRVW